MPSITAPSPNRYDEIRRGADSAYHPELAEPPRTRSRALSRGPDQRGEGTGSSRLQQRGEREKPPDRSRRIERRRWLSCHARQETNVRKAICSPAESLGQCRTQAIGTGEEPVQATPKIDPVTQPITKRWRYGHMTESARNRPCRESGSCVTAPRASAVTK